MKWTREEEDVLRKLGEAEATLEEVKKVFPHRSEHSIVNKAHEIRISLSGPKPTINFDEFKRILRASRKVEKI